MRRGWVFQNKTAATSASAGDLSDKTMSLTATLGALLLSVVLIIGACGESTSETGTDGDDSADTSSDTTAGDTTDGADHSSDHSGEGAHEDTDGTADATDTTDAADHVDTGNDATAETMIDVDSQDQEFVDGVVLTNSLLLSAEDSTTDASNAAALTAGDLFHRVEGGIGFVNDILHIVFDRVADIVHSEPSVRRVRFRRWDGQHNGFTWRFALLRVPNHRRFHYSLKVRPGDAADDAPYKRVMWGAFVRAQGARHRGAGRVHFNFDRMKEVHTDFAWSGRAQVRFRNHGDVRVVNVGVRNVVSPHNDEPLSSIAQYRRGAAGKRHFKFISRAEVFAGDGGRERFSARAKWRRDLGGRIVARVFGADVPGDNDHNRVRIRGCWDADRNWNWVETTPADLAGFPNEGSIDDCVSHYSEELVDVSEPDDVQVDPDTESSWELDDFDVGDELPSENDAAEGSAPSDDEST